jgi:hypothetical protein
VVNVKAVRVLTLDAYSVASVKRQGLEAEHLSPFDVEFKNECSHTSTP